uniref:Uncharacterized protein n=1 Tax=Amphimedon queenslandica TaxID=400682 RepID=A0A1X7UIL7_AMPQE
MRISLTSPPEVDLCEVMRFDQRKPTATITRTQMIHNSAASVNKINVHYFSCINKAHKNCASATVKRPLLTGYMMMILGS